MTETQSLISLASIFLLASCSPGPVFLLIASVSAKHGRIAGLRVGLGVASATFCWALGTVLGLGLLLSSMVWMQGLLKLTAGIYLMWLGLTMAANGLRKHGAAQQSVTSFSSPYRMGFIASISNPKALAFFGSVFVLTAPEYTTLRYQVAAIVTLTALSAVWHGFLAMLFATPMMQRGYRKLKKQMDVYVGAIFVSVGGWMVASAFHRTN